MRVQVRVQKKYFFYFKFKLGKMIEFFRVQVRSPAKAKRSGLTDQRFEMLVIFLKEHATNQWSCNFLPPVATCLYFLTCFYYIFNLRFIFNVF